MRIWKTLGSFGNPFAQKRQGIPPGFRALPTPARLPAPPVRQTLPAPANSKSSMVFSADVSSQAQSEVGTKITFKRRGLKDVARGSQGTSHVGGQEKNEGDTGTSKRRRADEKLGLVDEDPSAMD